MSSGIKYERYNVEENIQEGIVKRVEKN